MGIEADKEEIGSIVWVDRCKFAQDRANEGDHNTSDIGVLWAEDHIATQAATIAALEAYVKRLGDLCQNNHWHLPWQLLCAIRNVPEDAVLPPADTGESE